MKRENGRINMIFCGLKEQFCGEVKYDFFVGFDLGRERF